MVSALLVLLIWTHAYALPNLLVPAADYGVLEHYLEFIGIAGCVRSPTQLPGGYESASIQALNTTANYTQSNYTGSSSNSNIAPLTSDEYILPTDTQAKCKLFCENFPEMEFVKVWVDSSPVVGTVWGYVGVDHSSERIMVVTRGFMRYGKYSQLDHQPQELVIPEYDSKPACNDVNCKVDKVIYDAYSQVWAQVSHPLSATIKKYSRYSLFVAGHNIGGGIAQLMAVSLKLLNYHPLLVTVGAPAIGTPEFAEWHDKLFAVGGPIVHPKRNENGHWVPTKRDVIQITSLDHQFHSIEHFGSEKWPHHAHQFLNLHKFQHTGGRIGLKSDELGWPAAYYLDNFFASAMVAAATVANTNEAVAPEEGLIPPFAIPNENGVPEPPINDVNHQRYPVYDPFKYMYPTAWYAIPMYCEAHDLEEFSIEHDHCNNNNCQSLSGPWNMIPSAY